MGNRCFCGFGCRRPLPSIADVSLNIKKNAEEHHTDKYDATQQNRDLVIRRGQKFSLILHIDREFNPSKYAIVIIFKTGKSPKNNNGTLVRMQVLSEPTSVKQNVWQAWMEPYVNSKDVYINISTAADAIVARWNVEFYIVKKQKAASDSLTKSLFPVNGIYILFNPWCDADLVYLNDEDKLKEYVLNDVGKIWRGTKSMFSGMIWNYGQFEPGILEAAMAILDKSPRLRLTQRNNPIYVSREASAMVNSNDGDNGVIVGNWSGEYSDGAAPTEWQGSVRILNQWTKSQRPVRYGQCWVFAGVLTTVMRALGIASRPITNFESAHDSDATITYDIFIDSNGELQDDMSSDSVWNFHVWNEVWMSRADLPVGYGGWQIIDATPQERSENIFQAGPASRTAVRKGEVGYNFDAAFVFAEVNADKVIWLYNGEDEPVKLINTVTDAIGYFISTKEPGPLMRGNMDRRDVTNKYKAPEMSREERLDVMNALRTGRSPARGFFVSSQSKDIIVEITIEEIPVIGNTIILQMKLKNESSEERTVEGVLKIHSMLYTGALHELIKSELVHIVLEPNEAKVNLIHVRADEYLPKLIDQASMIASTMLKVDETKQMFHSDYNFQLKLPDIELQLKAPLKLGESSQILAKFKNPLDIQLTDGKVIIEGPGLEKEYEVHTGLIGPLSENEVILEVTPRIKGVIILIASFCSKELRNVNGSLTVEVES